MVVTLWMVELTYQCSLFHRTMFACFGQGLYHHSEDFVSNQQRYEDVTRKVSHGTPLSMPQESDEGALTEYHSSFTRKFIRFSVFFVVQLSTYHDLPLLHPIHFRR